eukprot:CAMPEP_0204313202 /NCGR_PEP_ID=MMETSP0469-20131031/3435_1 /ASSEMBLY_ACC=CAM_ASM_000384 /TAXON_ID=2969 /ORGANISM="Oxyrrhis marina" /LENGTH=72 /DNA_ID=CAMNT_0051293445 /DNA_START=294 /DNA_END=512 /DNA_ORIENTATION=-
MRQVRFMTPSSHGARHQQATVPLHQLCDHRARIEGHQKQRQISKVGDDSSCHSPGGAALGVPNAVDDPADLP